MWLTVQSGARAGERMEVTRALVIGRDPGVGLSLPDGKASREHARLTPAGDTLTLEDLGSTNGTYVGGQRIAGPVTLAGGEQITIGDTRLQVDAAASAAPVPPLTTPQADAAPPRPSVIERIALRRSINRSRTIALVAGGGVLVALVVVILFVTGVFGGEDDTPSSADIIETVTPSTVQIRGVGSDGTTFGLGTGWVYDAEQGLIVTNSHVATAATKLAVALGQEGERDAEVVGIAQCDDLALLRVEDTSGMKTIPVGAQADLRQGDTVIALGYPTTLAGGDPLITTEGIVSVVRTATAGDSASQVYPNVIQTDAVINPGNSGGPLVDVDARLVGVNTIKNVTPGVESQFFAIGVDRVKEIVPDLSESRSIGWPGMAFMFFPTAETLESLGLPQQAGLLVLGAHEGTDSAAQGWNDGPYLLVAIDGKPVDGGWRSYCDIVGDYRENEQAVFSVFAPGASETQDISVRFE
jgi:S1-C subfamily serine protease